MTASGKRADRGSDSSLAGRLDAMAVVVELADGRLDASLVDRCRSMVDSGAQRSAFGSDHTVVALAGATGSGKSSLFNALAAEQLASAGVRRPTTSTAEAVWFDGGASAEPLLDWLQVPRRHRRVEPTLSGLVLLDLPDHDSVEAAHRAEVDRLVEVVDIFCWVVDPEKYADAALHDDYLQRFAGHAAVTLVVVNQVDRLSTESRRQCTDDLRRLLREDGLGEVRVITTSTLTGEGVDELRSELGARVAEARAHIRRLTADLEAAARELSVACGDVVPECPDAGAFRPLVEALSAAASVDSVVDAVEEAHRLRSSKATGWPMTRWVAHRRPDPLRRIGLSERSAHADASADPIRATSRPGPDEWARSGVANALNTLVDDMTEGVVDEWRQRIRSVAHTDRIELADRLDRAVAATELPTGTPRWWAWWNAAQWAAMLCAAAGALWLLAIAAVAWLQLPDLPVPDLGSVPWPTALLGVGLAVGVVLALTARLLGAASAARRGAAARRRLGAAVESVARELVIDPLCSEASDIGHLAAAARAVAR